MEKDELTYKVIGCAMQVHNTLGNGFQEVIYQRCLAIKTVGISTLHSLVFRLTERGRESATRPDSRFNRVLLQGK